MNDESLTLPSVVARFRESEELLQQLGDQLRSLRLSAETSDEAASSLASAAEETRATSAALANLSHQLQEVTAALGDAAGAAAMLIERADAGKVLGAVEKVEPAVLARLEDVEATLLERLESLERAVSERWGAELRELASAVDALREAEERRSQQLHAAEGRAEKDRHAAEHYRGLLEQAMANLSPRALKKAGLATVNLAPGDEGVSA